MGKTAEFLNLPGGFHPTREQKKWKKWKLQKLRFSESWKRFESLSFQWIPEIFCEFHIENLLSSLFLLKVWWFLEIFRKPPARFSTRGLASATGAQRVRRATLRYGACVSGFPVPNSLEFWRKWWVDTVDVGQKKGCFSCWMVSVYVWIHSHPTNPLVTMNSIHLTCLRIFLSPPFFGFLSVVLPNWVKRTLVVRYFPWEVCGWEVSHPSLWKFIV